jgi:hypothetical protein
MQQDAGHDPCHRGAMLGVFSEPMDWRGWHEAYADPDSALTERLALVQERICVALDRMPAGLIRAISICAGQGHDLIGALAEHDRHEDIRARLIELDEDNVRIAREGAHLAELSGIEVAAGDASLSDAYIGAVPADLVILCGVFGNISAPDIQRTIAALPQLCAANATVIWTRHRLAPDITPMIRQCFEKSYFQELSFATEASGRFAVGSQQLIGRPEDLRPGQKLFDFLGFWSKELDA